ncbi:MAG: hypothetical protein M3434_01655, partial [Gemmatimonadota bacterium]|nr:hypothetical protein [Gemmatimonadota bacterium]
PGGAHAVLPCVDKDVWACRSPPTQAFWSEGTRMAGKLLLLFLHVKDFVAWRAKIFHSPGRRRNI